MIPILGGRIVSPTDTQMVVASVLFLLLLMGFCILMSWVISKFISAVNSRKRFWMLSVLLFVLSLLALSFLL